MKNQEPIALPASGGQTYSFSTETRVSGQCPPTAPQHQTNGVKSYIVNQPKTTTQGGGPVSSNIQERSYNQTSYSSETSKPIPIERSHELGYCPRAGHMTLMARKITFCRFPLKLEHEQRTGEEELHCRYAILYENRTQTNHK
ncbi:hypothetical protein ANCCAN_28261 [Ancylostoma caninum]|uniref:Uncharacterized protein n=1 Tax=Ancylostoma caninum TaxID=29170 RepID=A0A368F1R1_ANCCA|nr:hypothetical protein ANCCAN_28261 [Ancylostoma caninum]